MTVLTLGLFLGYNKHCITTSYTPGGPYNKIPLGRLKSGFLKKSGLISGKITKSLISRFILSSPPISYFESTYYKERTQQFAVLSSMLASSARGHARTL